jgi:hypothetical protein
MKTIRQLLNDQKKKRSRAQVTYHALEILVDKEIRCVAGQVSEDGGCESLIDAADALRRKQLTGNIHRVLVLLL